MRILLVEDHQRIAKELIKLLEANNYIVDWQISISLAQQCLLDVDYSAVIIDRGLPDGDGLELIHFFKKKFGLDKFTPFLVLSASGDTQDTVLGLSQGAVDYIVKPYNPDVLLARLQVAISLKSRRSSSKGLSHANVVYLEGQQQLLVNNQSLNLPRRQHLVFMKLFENLGTVITHSSLEEASYSYDDDINSNVIKSQVYRLRQSLETAGAALEIKAIRNVGYLMTSKV